MAADHSVDHVDLAALVEDPAKVAHVPPTRIPALLSQLSAVHSAIAARLMAADREPCRSSFVSDGISGSATAASTDTFVVVPAGNAASERRRNGQHDTSTKRAEEPARHGTDLPARPDLLDRVLPSRKGESREY